MKKIFTLLIGIIFFLTILNAQEAPPQAFSYKATIQRPNGNLVVTKTISLKISILQNSIGGIAVYTETFLPTTNIYGQIDIEIGHGKAVTGDFSSVDWSADEYFLKVEVDIKGGSNYTVLSVTQLLSIPYALYAGKAGSVKNELDPLFSAHPANGITLGNIGNWNTAFGWGNHALQGYALLQNIYTKFDLQTEGNSLIHWNNLTNKPDFATVATTGNYADLINLPIIPSSLNQITPDAGNRIITNVAQPVTAQDAATKAYVDALQERVSALEKLLGVGNEDDVATDIDGNVYDTVVIGTQVWMKQNLKVTRYRNGDSIPNITGTEWGIQSSGAYCLYNNGIMSDTIYGALYNWYAVADSRNICPTGWHVPTDGEWTVLTTFLGGETIAGDKLKEAGTAHWQTPNSLATDEFGYTALPGGYRDPGARFANQSVAGFWWSSTENNADYAISRLMAYNISRVGMSTYPKKFGKSVRCLKGEAVPVNLPVVTTMDITNITAIGANSGGRVISDAGSPVTTRGVCWNMAPSPIIAYSKTINGADTGAFVSVITNLQPGRTYYVRAYATNVSGTAYGNEVSFTTNPGLPTVSTAAITSVASTTATGGGSVNWDGGAAVTQRGICWSISSTPTTADGKTLNGSGNGTFVSYLTGLSPNTVYYVRAYALNSIGTGYGPIRSFTTSNAPLTTPTVYTDTITSITSTTAIGGGYISKDGGFPISDRGVCWSTSINPTTANIRISNGADTGRYVCNLTGLISSTTYYVRAYAINSSGTAYGQEMSFTTPALALAIGDSYQGGKIAYILQPGDPDYIAGETHGLIAAPISYRQDIAGWGCSNTETNAVGDAIGSGLYNTQIICSLVTCIGTAARLCDALDIGGYQDWILPSKNELNMLYINKAIIGNFESITYWSSTEVGRGTALAQNFVDGNQYFGDKNAEYNVRAIRYF